MKPWMGNIRRPYRPGGHNGPGAMHPSLWQKTFFFSNFSIKVITIGYPCTAGTLKCKGCSQHRPMSPAGGINLRQVLSQIIPGAVSPVACVDIDCLLYTSPS